MKPSCKHLIAIAALTASLHTIAFAAPEGQVDFSKFAAPVSGSEFVEVQVSSNLISLAAKLVEKQQPDVAKLLRTVQLVRVNVVGLTDTNRAEMTKRIHDVRKELDTAGWERVVTASKQEGEDVGVYLKTRGGEAVAGLAVSVLDPKKAAILINIVGDIHPEQIVAVGEALNIEPLKQAGAAIK